MYKHLAMDMT